MELGAGQSPLTVVEMDESSGLCACCGRESRCVWGRVDAGEITVAAYWMHWTPGHLQETGANLDLVLGNWGEGATPDDRLAVALVHREEADGTPALMVIDAGKRPVLGGELASTALARQDVIGTPMAEQVFALADAIYEQDRRFF